MRRAARFIRKIMKNIKEILAKNGFSFKKQLGQNFITDETLLGEIVAAAGIEKEDTVLEIGCGAGTLTRALAAKAKRVVGFEIDKNLAPVLEETVGGCGNVSVRFADIMRADLAALERELGAYKVAANLPYYITTPVIMRFIEGAKGVKTLAVMVQEEVAKRLCAAAGTADYGAITAAVDFAGSARIAMRVGKERFFPVPKVDSAVVRIDIDREKSAGCDAKAYRAVVRAAFSSRRKTLCNNLMQAFSLKREEAEKLLSFCGIGALARGETLDCAQFKKLAKAYGEKIWQKD